MKNKSMVHRAWFYGTILLIVALIVVALVATYFVVDSSVTVAYFRDTIMIQSEQLEVFSKLLPELHRGQSQDDILAILRELYPDGFITEGDAFMTFNSIVFRFSAQGQLTSVEI